MILYNLADPKQTQEAADLLASWGVLGKTIEMKIHKPKRSNPQNRGLHLLLGYLSNNSGYTLEECKELYKSMNRGIYEYEKNGHTFTRSSADLDQAEMAKSIDKLYQVCGENGIELPLLTDEGYMREIEREIERNGHYN